MPGSLLGCVVIRGGIAHNFFWGDGDIKGTTVSLRGKSKAKYPESAEGRRYGSSDPHPIGATT